MPETIPREEKKAVKEGEEERKEEEGTPIIPIEPGGQWCSS